VGGGRSRLEDGRGRSRDPPPGAAGLRACGAGGDSHRQAPAAGVCRHRRRADGGRAGRGDRGHRPARDGAGFQGDRHGVGAGHPLRGRAAHPRRLPGSALAQGRAPAPGAGRRGADEQPGVGGRGRADQGRRGVDRGERDPLGDRRRRLAAGQAARRAGRPGGARAGRARPEPSRPSERLRPRRHGVPQGCGRSDRPRPGRGGDAAGEGHGGQHPARPAGRGARPLPLPRQGEHGDHRAQPGGRADRKAPVFRPRCVVAVGLRPRLPADRLPQPADDHGGVDLGLLHAGTERAADHRSGRSDRSDRSEGRAAPVGQTPTPTGRLSYKLCGLAPVLRAPWFL